MTALKVGAGIEAATECGPMITKKGLDKIDRLVQNAAARGARVLCGARSGAEGFLLSSDSPLRRAGRRRDGARGNLRTCRADLALRTGERSDRAGERHGIRLAAYIYTRDLVRGMRVAAKIETGMIALNRGLVSDPVAPFGGAKQSGIGREGGQRHGSPSSWKRNISQSRYRQRTGAARSLQP
jgi:succinate-semialdehyde dehydrogenase / glutarate-semialdehyde dehydrogenase